MARPLKEGLDYFPLDVDADQDDKLLVPVAMFGMQGYGIIIKLMSEIYKNGYCYKWGKLEQYTFAKRVNVDINLIKEVVNECIEYQFFSEIIFKEHQILTSRGFQKRYVEAVKRRKEIVLIDEYVLADLREISERLKITILTVDVNGNRVNEYIYDNKSPVAVTVSTQSKVKNIKVNKSKEIKDLKELHESEFNRFWILYPSKKGKTKALAKWLTIAPKLDFEKVMTGTQAYIDFCKAADRTHQDGSTFVNNQAWGDDWTIKKSDKFRPLNRVPTGTSNKPRIEIIGESQSSGKLEPDDWEKAMLQARLLDGELTQEQYNTELAELEALEHAAVT